MKTIIIFVLLLICCTFSIKFTNATGFEDLLPLWDKSIALNEGGFILNKMLAIYKISSKIKPERIYIGSATNFKKRKCVHLTTLAKNSHYNLKLQRHVNKYSIEDIKIEILELVMFKEDLIIREQFYLDTLNPYFNICKRAGSTLGTRCSKETIQKIKETKKGRKYVITEETRAKLRKARAGKKPCLGKIGINKGRKASEATKQKMREACKLRLPKSKETREKMSEAHKGIKNGNYLHGKCVRVKYSIDERV